MESEQLIITVFSLALILLTNIFVFVIILNEYIRSKHEFVRYLVAGQFTIVLWHFISVYLSFYGASIVALLLTNITVLLSSLLFLKAVLVLSNYVLLPRMKIFCALFVLAIIILVSILNSDPLAPVWFMTSIVFFVTVFLTLRCTELNSRRLIATLQFFLAPLYGIGIAVVFGLYPAIGGLIYFFVALLIPLITILFLQESIQMSAKRMQRTELIHRDLFDSVRDIFFRIDVGGFIEVVSASVEIFGYKADDINGKSLNTLYADPSVFDQHMLQVLQGDITNTQAFNLRTKAVLLVECDLLAKCVDVSEKNTVAIVGTIRDVSERNQLEKQFLDAQRRESLGILAGGMAHDFNNLLQGIVGRVDLLQMDLDESSEIMQQHLSVILEASNTVALLCKHLLEYAGKAQHSAKAVCIKSAVNDVVEILRPSISENDLEIELNFSSEDMPVDADITQFRQAILNIVKNALDAVREDSETGKVSISVRQRSLSEVVLSEARIGSQHLVPGTFVCIEIRDNGSGIDSSVIQRIFDPFYSTKPEGHGLGLAAISGILRSHNAGIFVESERGTGSLFTVVLPLLRQGLPQEQPSAAVRPVGGAHRTVLFADDEPGIRKTTVSALQNHGYKVLVAKDGEEAVQLFQKERASISVVLMDIKMPIKDGIEAAREIRALSPAIPVVLASGYVHAADRLSPAEVVSLKFLTKPYRRAQLLSSVGEALGEKL
jgi:PAS domain S-box-containing protein